VQASARRLLAGRRDLRALWDLPLDLLLSPVALGYFVAGRVVFAKSFVATSACDHCGACVQECPVGGVRLVEGRPYWTFQCESCMRCMNGCPRRAIETAHGFVAAPFAFAALATAGLLHPILGIPGPLRASAMFRLALETVVLLAILGAAYRLLHAGLRFRAVDRLIAGTSLTHLGAWGRYRGVRTGGAVRLAARSTPTGGSSTGMATGSASWLRPKG
jgi:Pyruvate/2-oxoacid:ferredoxin oxidoreductase delta subunit